jgi:hypothetical protein
MAPINRFRGGRIAVPFAAVAGLLISLAVATPAQADEHCGAWKVVRTSISYRACTYTSGSSVRAKAEFQNNHGSPVDETWQYGHSINGGAVRWGVATQDRLATGRSSKVAGGPGISCIHTRLVVRASAKAGDPPPWGDGSYDSERSWPC